MAKAISFKKGGGHLAHNNRKFVNDNVDPERISWDRIYIQEPLEVAYEKCFGEALRKYNESQKRKDRQKGNYIKEIENSGNGEHVFYENIVQIGKMTDTPVIDENGRLTEAAKEAIEVLDRYARTFQERNPNLYLFNCVMHLDERTPHLHMDYIPVAHGYKKGMETRNSLTKAYQQMGFAKATSKKQNETMAWQVRERSYLTDLCRARGIETEIIGVRRDDYSLPEYKEAMRKVETLGQQADVLEGQKKELEQGNTNLVEVNLNLQRQSQEIAEYNRRLRLKAKEQEEKMEEARALEKEQAERLAKYDLRESSIKTIAKEINAEEKNLRGMAQPIPTLFGGEEYVKVKKSDWNKMLDTCKRAATRNHLLDKYEKKITVLEKKVEKLTVLAERQDKFILLQGLKDKFEEYMKSFLPKTLKQKIAEAKVEAEEYNKKQGQKGKEKNKDLGKVI